MTDTMDNDSNVGGKKRKSSEKTNHGNVSGKRKKRVQTNWMTCPANFERLQRAINELQTGNENIAEVAKRNGIPYHTLYNHKYDDKLVYKKRGGSKAKFKPQDDKSVHCSTAEHFAEMSLGGWKTNCELIKFVLKSHRFYDKNTLVVDLTNGEGKFTPTRGYPSGGPRTVKFDKYKNMSADPVLYPDVMPYDDSLMEKFYGMVDVAMFDPPYSSVIGNHNALNCVIRNSVSRMKFNGAYGVNFCYSDAQIHHFYVTGFEMASKMLKLGGVVMMKVMNFKHLQMRDNLISLANCCGFVLYGKHYTLVKSKTPQDEYSDIGSSLLLFKKAGGNQRSLINMYGGGKTPEEMIKTNITTTASRDYCDYVKKSVSEMKIWCNYGLKMTNWIGKSFGDVEAGIPEQLRSSFKKCTNPNGDWCSLFEEIMLENLCVQESVNVLQDRAILANRMLSDVKNYVAFVWEGVLLQCSIDISSNRSRDEKVDVAYEITGNQKFSEGLNNKGSHVALSENLRYLREALRGKK